MTSKLSTPSKESTKDISDLSSKKRSTQNLVSTIKISWSRFFLVIFLATIGMAIISVGIAMSFANYNCKQFNKNSHVEVGRVIIGYICPIFDHDILFSDIEYKGFIVEDTIKETKIY